MIKTNKNGKVYLVGAGPGDPELITVKGYNILKEADVIFYDRLVNIELLKDIKAKKIFVGKKKNIHYFSQDEINKQIVESAKQGKLTVRLKGGDPLIFGRGGEEIEILKKHNIEYEVIPGLSSSTAITSSMGLPLTHRGIAASFAVVTGHRKKGERSAKIPKADTIVFLMGLSALSKIVNDLLKEGYSKDSTIAVISKGTLRDMRYISGSLSDIESKVNAEKLESPAIAVFGKVIGWYDDIKSQKESKKAKALIKELVSHYL